MPDYSQADMLGSRFAVQVRQLWNGIEAALTKLVRRERISIELMTSDRQLKAPRQGSNSLRERTLGPGREHVGLRKVGGHERGRARSTIRPRREVFRDELEPFNIGAI